MAAYAALVSLMTTLNNILNHPLVSSFFDHNHIQSLHKIINFLLDYTESSNSRGGSREEEEVVLEGRIASTAHAVEDVIESHVVDQLLARSSVLLDLVKEIENMNSFKETLMVIESRGKIKSSHSVSAASSKTTPTKKNFMVGFDEKLIQIMDRLTGQQPDLQAIPIVGMGGIGKTVLAKSVHDNLLIVESFDIRAWVSISQEYSVKNILSQLLSCIESVGDIDCEIDQLGLKLYQTLTGRRYLVVLDDIWSIDAWDKIKFFFPNNGQRSRIVITTRVSSVATHLSSSLFEIDFLDHDQSWKLFCGNVFLDKCCPPELEEIGKKIVGECKGLPLSIVVIGGLLRNSISTREFWENFGRDLNSILMSGNDAHCLNILSLSYNHLPAHLKPCFLFMGVFPEDERISVSRVIKFFVAEGFLKPKEGQTLEEVAEDYFNALVDRNLILVDSWHWSGRVRFCKMHDLVREVCLKIGTRETFFYGMRKLHIPTSINRERRIVFDGIMPKKESWLEVFDAHPLASLVRTFLICNGGSLPFKVRLLRVLTHVHLVSLEDIFQQVNLQYLNFTMQDQYLHYKVPSSVSLLWNLHTLIGKALLINAPSEIWYMRQLRHVEFIRGVVLPDPPPSEKVEQHDILLPNLQTLFRVVNLSFTKEVCERMPNINKLGIECDTVSEEEGEKKFFFYLDHLHKLQSLCCSFDALKRGEILQSLVIPSSLRKLTLVTCGLHWDDINTFGLSLPHLQVLKLYWGAVVGPEWDCVEGAFPHLKFLYIVSRDLIKWTAESSDYFPVLETLILIKLRGLERIPSSIGEIQTLKSLHVKECRLSAAISAVEILEEQLSLGNDDLQVEVEPYFNSEQEMKSLKEMEERMSSTISKNFKFVSPF